MKNIPMYHIVDGYKLDHISQYIKGTESVLANCTPRSDRLANVLREHFDGKMVNFGIEMVTKVLFEQWEDTFFSRPKREVIRKYTRRIKNYVGPDHGDRAIEAMSKLHDLGHLPVEIRALPEGCKVNMGVPVFTVRNTHPDFYWITNYCETFMSTMYWPMANAATVSEQYYKTSKFWAEESGADPSWLAIANHCFAGRGHRGQEDGMISAMGHLLFGVGTDTLWAIDGIEQYYNGNSDNEMIGVSVNAFEHATATQRIAYFRNNLGFNEFPLQAETESLRDIYTNVYPKGIVSYVLDSEDYFGMLEFALPQVKDEILARTEDSWGLCKAVFRPDSSIKSPLEVICGYAESDIFRDENGVAYDRAYVTTYGSDSIMLASATPLSEAEVKGSLQLLWDTFGGTLNDKGLRLLNPKVGLIYGEAITPQMQWNIYETMVADGWCVSNVLMGVGSWGFLKDSSRDSYSLAIKGTHSIINGEGVSMQKNPKTARGAKKSACGLLRVSREGNKYRLWDKQTEAEALTGELAIIGRNSKMIRETHYEDIRKVAQAGE